MDKRLSVNNFGDHMMVTWIPYVEHVITTTESFLTHYLLFYKCFLKILCVVFLV